MPSSPTNNIVRRAGLAQNDLAYRFAQGGVPYRVSWFSYGANPTESDWLEVVDTNFTLVELSLPNSSTYSGKFQASIDDGMNWYDIVPEAGSAATVNPITAAGFFRFTGPYQYIKFVGTTITGGLTTPTSAAFATATTGGTLLASTTYFYRVSAISIYGETLAFTEVSQTTGASTATNTVTVNWNTVTNATGYRIYGRTTGKETLIAQVATGTTYVDTGTNMANIDTTQAPSLVNTAAGLVAYASSVRL